MELRDEFAREAMKEMNWTSTVPTNLKVCAEACYAIADAMMAARGDVWVTWSGGACPVPVGTECSVRFRCGEERVILAYDDRGWDWTDKDESSLYDIIAYRIDK